MYGCYIVQGLIARKKAVCIQYRHNFFPDIFGPWLVESMDAKPVTSQGLVRVLTEFVR
jgi:hypothetical protein